MYNFKKQLNSLLKFDSIRILKLLEMIQYSIIGFILTLFFGNIINDIFFFKYDIQKLTNFELLYNVLIELIIIVILLYYIRKIVLLIPFLFLFLNKKYIPSKKNEASIGYIVGIGFILNNTINRLTLKIEEIDRRFKNYINI